MTPLIKTLVAVAASALLAAGAFAQSTVVDPEGTPFTARTVTFTVPGPVASSR